VSEGGERRTGRGRGRAAGGLGRPAAATPRRHPSWAVSRSPRGRRETAQRGERCAGNAVETPELGGLSPLPARPARNTPTFFGRARRRPVTGARAPAGSRAAQTESPRRQMGERRGRALAAKRWGRRFWRRPPFSPPFRSERGCRSATRERGRTRGKPRGAN
jgi:hypothetical protein